MPEPSPAVGPGRGDDLGDRVDEPRRLLLHLLGTLAGEVCLDEESGHAATIVSGVARTKVWRPTRIGAHDPVVIRAGAEIVGREAEISAIEAFLGDRAALPASLVIEGPAGAGKSTLWQSAVGRATETGHAVL